MIDIEAKDLKQQSGRNIFKNCDCMDLMKEYPDKYFDLAIVDPPYGIGICNNVEKNKGGTDSWKKHKNKEWDKNPPLKKYWRELYRVSKNQIIFGANYFIYDLPKITKGWIIWDKINHALTMSDAEIIYTSFDCKTRVYYENFGTERGVNAFFGDIHPTQKSTIIYSWLLQNYAKKNDLILDTHVGSASSLIACEELGFNYVACELDKDYYEAAVKRINNYRMQGNLFPPE